MVLNIFERLDLTHLRNKRLDRNNGVQDWEQHTFGVKIITPVMLLYLGFLTDESKGLNDSL
jgi:hypothetical protein